MNLDLKRLGHAAEVLLKALSFSFRGRFPLICLSNREWTFAPAGSDHFRAKEAKHRAIVIALAFYLGPRHFSRFAFAILP